MHWKIEVEMPINVAIKVEVLLGTCTGTCVHRRKLPIRYFVGTLTGSLLTKIIWNCQFNFYNIAYFPHTFPGLLTKIAPIFALCVSTWRYLQIQVLARINLVLQVPTSNCDIRRHKCTCLIRTSWKIHVPEGMVMVGTTKFSTAVLVYARP